jgi:hypothetical protein
LAQKPSYDSSLGNENLGPYFPVLSYPRLPEPKVTKIYPPRKPSRASFSKNRATFSDRFTIFPLNPEVPKQAPRFAILFRFSKLVTNNYVFSALIL